MTIGGYIYEEMKPKVYKVHLKGENGKAKPVMIRFYEKKGGNTGIDRPNEHYCIVFTDYYIKDDNKQVLTDDKGIEYDCKNKVFTVMTAAAYSYYKDPLYFTNR